jgi:DNA-binding MarR family transcriptional regulator/N-acetylglutamate synthase-like GNAT family acetyltransferase
VQDILKERGHLFLGSRLKRLGERMQADVLRIIETAGLPIQPSQYPLLVALERNGPLTVSEMVQVTGISQPGVTRSLNRLVEYKLVDISKVHRDQRHKTITLTAAGQQAMARSRRDVWPRVESAVIELCKGLSGHLLDQVGAMEDLLAKTPLHRRVPAAAAQGLCIRPFSDDLAGDFFAINAQWIESMFTMEPTDLEVLRNPRAHIIEPGGDILFVEAEGQGIIGACALQKTGEREFELTKMGVLEAARGRKAGEYLLRATLQRAAELQADVLYLLTSSACVAAIHLYEKLGFEHDAQIMSAHGARYWRCDVAMRYRPRIAG